ncbi:MAG: hypothetical protein U1F33_17980 [Alphaproteobacteria bacterium]
MRRFLSSSAVATVLLMLPVAAMAQTVGSEVQRDVNQQQRIEQGLQSGQLTTGEAARLERGEARIDRMESRSLRDGTLTNAEKARIGAAQNRESAAIYGAKHNGLVGNPDSPSSQRMQADVQRNVNQQQRIEQGVQSGRLTNREVGRLEGGQARIDRKEARAGADGHVGPREQWRVQHAENAASHHIYRAKHNGQWRQ